MFKSTINLINQALNEKQSPQVENEHYDFNFDFDHNPIAYQNLQQVKMENENLANFNYTEPFTTEPETDSDLFISESEFSFLTQMAMKNIQESQTFELPSNAIKNNIIS